jgi:hypothetical protein
VRYFGEQGEAPRKMRRAKFSVACWQSALAYLSSPPAVVRPLSQSLSNTPALIRFTLEVAIDYLPYGYLLLPSSAFPGGIQEY